MALAGNDLTIDESVGILRVRSDQGRIGPVGAQPINEGALLERWRAQCGLQGLLYQIGMNRGRGPIAHRKFSITIRSKLSLMRLG